MDTGEYITKAIGEAGLMELAQACGVTYQAVRKWERRGRLPRTEWTGETDYAVRIERACGGAVTQAQLLGRANDGRSPDANDSDPRAVSTRRTHEYDRRHEHGRRQADTGDVEPV